MKRSFVIIFIAVLLMAVMGCAQKVSLPVIPEPIVEPQMPEQPTTPDIEEPATPDLIFMAGNPPDHFLVWSNPKQKINIVNLKGDIITVFRFKEGKPIRYDAVDPRTRSKLITRPINITETDQLKIVCKFHYCTTMVYFK